MSNINKAAVLNPFTNLTANILDYVPRATTSEFGIVAIGSGINVDALGRIYLDTQEYSDRLTAIEAQAASSLDTQQTAVAAAIAQANLTQSQTITALTLEVSNLKTDLTNSITATQSDLINRADQLAQDVTDITVQLTQDKATFTQEIQDALDFLKDDASVASALRTPRKIQGVAFDGTQDISLPTFTAETDGLVPKRVGSTADNYLREDGTWVVPTDTTYDLLTKASAETGTATTANTISAQVLKEAIQYHAPTVTNIVGNAATATKLQTPCTINGISFDGSQDILLPASGNYSLPTASGSVLGGIKVGSGLSISNSFLSVSTLNQSTTGNAATATKLQTPRTISLTGRVIGSASFDGSANVSLTTVIPGLGAANGIATLDPKGQVPSSQLPSYVADVLEYANVAAFPTTGVAGKIYVETTGNTTYRWSGTGYVKITSGEVSSVAGKTGVVNLSKADVGLGNVDNTSDANKPVSNSTQAAIISAVSPKADKNYVDNQLSLKANKADVYTKQESSDLVSNSISTALTPINTSLDLAKRGIANRYDSSLTYNSGERVVLSNGDIVKSTVDGNTNDPNVDMAGWVNREAEQNAINVVTMKYVVSTDELLAIESPATGWAYHALNIDTTYAYDSAQSTVNNGGTILNGWVARGLNYVTPEMFGADPTGATSSRLAIKAMLDSLAVGGVIECRPNAIYYNDAPLGTSDVWDVSKDKTYIIANGAAFKRRPTAPETSSIDHNLSALKITGKNVTIEGKVYFDGSESLASIVNSSNTVVAAGDYARGYASSHGLHLFGADYFTALQVDSNNAVFNIFADGCVGLNIKGRCKSSGQVYPVTGVDLNLGSGIKLSYCTDYDIDLYTEYAGYCGVEVEPACRFGRVNSVARWASHHGVSFHGDCEGTTVSSIAENCQLGSALRLGAGSRQINGTFSAKDSHIGLWVEPSSSDTTITGDITLCNITGTSNKCSGGSFFITNTPSGGRLRESNINVRSNKDGGGTTQAVTLENAENCNFNVGVKTAKSALVVNRIYDSELHVAYMTSITDANPMFFTADNTVDVSFKQGTTSYDLKRTIGHVMGSSLITTNEAIPVKSYVALDLRADQIVTPNLQTSNASTLTSGLWVDTANSNTVKRK